MTTFEKVQKLIAEHLTKSIDEITEEADIIKDLDADSIDIVEMIMTLEDEFGITIPDEKISSLQTVKDIVKIIDENN